MPPTFLSPLPAKLAAASQLKSRAELAPAVKSIVLRLALLGGVPKLPLLPVANPPGDKVVLGTRLPLGVFGLDGMGELGPDALGELALGVAVALPELFVMRPSGSNKVAVFGGGGGGSFFRDEVIADEDRGLGGG